MLDWLQFGMQSLSLLMLSSTSTCSCGWGRRRGRTKVARALDATPECSQLYCSYL